MKTAMREGIEIVVIGAGAGGAKTALLLAELGHRVILLDARDKVGVPDDTKEEKINQKGISTSWINPGRAGHGFHYIHLKTGKMLMESTIGLYRQYPELPIGSAYPNSHPLRKGRYFITKDSLFKKDEVLAVYSQLQEHYRLLVKNNPDNQVLGHPDDFFHILEQKEYEKYVDVNTVAVGIETTERLINPVLLSQILFQRIKEEKNITLLTDKKVTQVNYGRDKTFIVSLQDGSSIAADQVINCAWENMEAIDQTIGLVDVSTKSTNRLKALAVVELPQELHNQHSMFFCMGPFCMLSNLGNGTGLMTYAPITNIHNEYDLFLMLDDTKPEKNKIYVRKIENFLEYIVLAPNGEPVTDRISQEEFKQDIPEPFSIDKLKPFLPEILEITAKNGHTLTNYQDYKINELGRRLLEGKASPEEIKHYGEGIIKGVSQWIPVIAKAKLITVRFGVVKTYGGVDIFDPRSAVHNRDYFGVDSKQIGYIDNNACMKLMNLNENAKLVVELSSLHLDTEVKIKALSHSITKKMAIQFPKLLELFLNHYSRRQFSPKDFLTQEKIEKLNSSLIAQIKNKEKIQAVFSNVPKDYPARLMLIYLTVRKILPNIITEIITGYYGKPRTIGNSHPTFAFRAPQFLAAYVRKPLVIKVATSVDDSSLKTRVKREKQHINRSYSYGAVILWDQPPQDASCTFSNSNPNIYRL